MAEFKNYKIIQTWRELGELIEHCKTTGYASIDFETSGHPWHSPLGYPTILGVSFQPGSAWIIPLGHFDSPFRDNYEDILGEFCTEVISNPKIIKIAHNIKFEMKWFRKYGYEMKGILMDSMLAKYLLDEERPMGLKPLVDKFIPKYAGYAEDYPGSKLPWDEKPLEGLSQYCALDCSNTFQLMLFFEKQLMNNKLYSLFRNMYMMAARVLDHSEYDGVPIDEPLLTELEKKYEALIIQKDKDLRDNRYIKRFEKSLIKTRVKTEKREIKSEIKVLRKEKRELKKRYNETHDKSYLTAANRKVRGIETRKDKIRQLEVGDFSGTKKLEKLAEPVNFSSPAQMVELLYNSKKGFKFEPFKFTVDKKTKEETNTPSTDEATLLELAKKDKTGFMENLLDYRGLTKMNSAFIKGIRDRLDIDNRLHSRYLLTGTVTGRLCIGRDCLLHTNKGLIKIGDIVPLGDDVVEVIEGYEVLSHTGEYKPITHVINKGKEMMYEVELENGKKITCTKNHVFLTDSGWKRLKDIQDGDKIISWNDSENI